VEGMGKEKGGKGRGKWEGKGKQSPDINLVLSKKCKKSLCLL